MSHTVGIVMVGLVLMLAGPAQAKSLPWERGQRDSGARAEKMEQRIKSKRAELIRNRIGLSEAEGEQVLATLERFDDRRRELMEKRRGLRQSMERLFESDSEDQAEYERVIAGLRALEDAAHRLRGEQADALAKVVSPKYQLRILVAMKRFQKRLHKRQGEHRRERRERGPRGDRGRRGAR